MDVIKFLFIPPLLACPKAANNGVKKNTLKKAIMSLSFKK
jgi:hypothetical protein